MPLLRDLFIHLSENKVLNDATKKIGLKFGADKVVGGIKVEDTLERIRDLNGQGMGVTFDNLGEFITEKSEALEEKDNIIEMIKAIDEHGLDAHASVKLSQIGLHIDHDFCLENVREILTVAKQADMFVNLDMENYASYDDTIRLLDTVREEFDNVGTVIQSYLFNSREDIIKYRDMRLRLVKGAYKEAPEVAFQAKKDIDAAYLRLIKTHLLEGSGYTSIATHDHNIIEETIDFIKENDIPNDSFEFQMLYGFRKDYQRNLVSRGYRTIVYVPFGKDWYAYFMRRLAERPQNINLVIKGVTKDKRVQTGAAVLAGAGALLGAYKLIRNR